MYFCNFVIISQCKKVWSFHLNKLKSSVPKDAFCQVWLQLADWFHGGRFPNVVNVFSLFHNQILSEKGGGLHLSNLILWNHCCSWAFDVPGLVGHPYPRINIFTNVKRSNEFVLHCNDSNQLQTK